MKPIRRQMFDSVILQILLAMLLIAAMALASMSLSVYVTVDTQDDAEAINLAGSLRMQSYRIANILSRAADGEIENPREALQREREVFSEKLYRSSITESILQSGNTPLQKSYQKVMQNWAQEVEPLLSSATLDSPGFNWNALKREYNQHLGRQVNDIDLMVNHMQRSTEGKIELLGMTEGTSIILIIFIMVFFIMKADTNFIAPLRDLVVAANKVKSGDLAYRTSYTGRNELGLLSQTFNDMTESLQAQYQTLEDEVTARTQELHKSNQALYFLYKTSREIASTPYDQQLLNVFLADLKKLVEVDLINLCVNSEPNYPSYDLITTSARASESLCFGDCDDCGLSLANNSDAAEGSLSLPLRNRDDVFGFMHVRIAPDSSLEPWQYQLLETVGETLSTAFAFHHTLGQERRLILHEERSTIARELHDSLAQSLSYMKLETARLKKMIARGFEQEKIESALTDMQIGLNAAYKHLRELLVTFRVKLDAPNLRVALEQTVEEFSSQTTANISLDYDLGTYSMGPNDDIHILHILREALTNAIKHANAENIVLRCARDEGCIIFAVEDDGVGMSDNPEKQHHYGIYTMRERAQRLQGEFICARRDTGGTSVRLQLKSGAAQMQA